MSQHNNPYEGMTNPYAGYGSGYVQQGYNPYHGFAPAQQNGYGGYPQQFQGLDIPGAPGVPQQAGADVPGMLPLEASYIENILRLNKGKLATVHMSFNGNAKTFKGIVEAAGRDHIIISDPQTGMRHLLLMVYLDYVTFNEELDYEYPYAAGAPGLSAYPPR
ncbi:spore coat protein GerQ [Cytobacillus sp. S13-E01]|uniref:spore coat protein GerQ n=1 Tax=Cytobacillus sp. S13-E01 TaxID=3031326 RepID=UPI0023D859BE|nr:spore coat protein GerQ [Cytobacillus sp. S13-E01]MDF0726673.1 spore coat protein GerQ [Cytobacillus sp. S13-E01]